jgi:Lrp/AsnC family transcriptional regulator, leucine-responsive regulatory protein
MATIDQKDAVLLQELIRDARTPLQHLAKAIQLSATATQYRVSRLEKNGVIKRYKLILNKQAFSYSEYDVYYSLIFAPSDTIARALSQFRASPFTTQVLSTAGFCDIRITVLAKNAEHLQQILEHAELPISAHIRSRFILGVTKKYKTTAQHFLSALFGARVSITRKKPIAPVKSEHVILDAIDAQLLRALAGDPRASYAHLASLVKLTPEAVSSRVKQLEKKHVIEGYTTLIDGQHLGYLWAVLLLNVRYRGVQEREQLNAQIKDHPYVSSAAETMGNFNFTITFFGNSLENVHNTELELRTRFGEHVMDSALLFILQNEKYPDIAQGILTSE